MKPVGPPYSHHSKVSKSSSSSNAGEDSMSQLKRYGEVLITKGSKNRLRIEACAFPKDEKRFGDGCPRIRSEGRRSAVHLCWHFTEGDLQNSDPQDVAIVKAIYEILRILKTVDSNGERSMTDVAGIARQPFFHAGPHLDNATDSMDVQTDNNQPSESRPAPEIQDCATGPGPKPSSRDSIGCTENFCDGSHIRREELEERSVKSTIKSETVDHGSEESRRRDARRSPHTSLSIMTEEKWTIGFSGKKRKRKPSDSRSEFDPYTKFRSSTRGIRSEFDPYTVPEVDHVFQGPAWSSDDQRTRVTTLLNQFRYLRKLYRIEYTKRGAVGLRPDTRAGNYMKSRGYTLVLGRRIIGAIPGVECGDRFHSREEMALVGLHCQLQGGIDYFRSTHTNSVGNRLLIAVSISVAIRGWSGEI
ncbi:hypothetical protein AXG93_1660s1250 [Marchantia polymorpha subsp. ruderalis]|uniref:YDG domain-containing protein n=1 Tax=Marchantia polymorpha subsp. ruderalis TaxID=1480154 RepID=A0A176VU13_MARPO|nr:hypothetical protein AXG93_1660s1250 [Marchantia polymorpha subsp. ruderalis]